MDMRNMLPLFVLLPCVHPKSDSVESRGENGCCHKADNQENDAVLHQIHTKNTSVQVCKTTQNRFFCQTKKTLLARDFLFFKKEKKEQHVSHKLALRATTTTTKKKKKEKDHCVGGFENVLFGR